MLTSMVNNIEERAMQTAKQEVEQLLKNLPDDSSYEDIQYHLYVLEKIKRGQASIEQGRGIGHEEARERLSKWLKP
jgi:predicted transcriptional regulator